MAVYQKAAAVVRRRQFRVRGLRRPEPCSPPAAWTASRSWPASVGAPTGSTGVACGSSRSTPCPCSGSHRRPPHRGRQAPRLRSASSRSTRAMREARSANLDLKSSSALTRSAGPIRASGSDAKAALAGFEGPGCGKHPLFRQHGRSTPGAKTSAVVVRLKKTERPRRHQVTVRGAPRANADGFAGGAQACNAPPMVGPAGAPGRRVSRSIDARRAAAGGRGDGR